MGVDKDGIERIIILDTSRTEDSILKYLTGPTMDNDPSCIHGRIAPSYLIFEGEEEYHFLPGMRVCSKAKDFCFEEKGGKCPYFTGTKGQIDYLKLVPFSSSKID